jgi:succinate dehydrogenase / fumarate reductase iron-sulfur subunit
MTETKRRKIDFKEIKYKVQRYDPEVDKKPHMQDFTVPFREGMTVLEGLIYIKENLDPTLAFRTSCRMGICGSCGMLINDYPFLACHTQIEEFHTDKLTVKPLPNHPIIKDLVPDLATFFANHRSIKPYIIRDDKAEMDKTDAELKQTPEELDTFLQFSYCIKCGICVAACPTSASDKKFLGPQALAQCYRYSSDSRDDGFDKRVSAVDAEHGVWHCHFAGACSEACPKGVDPAMAMQLLKRRMVSKAIGSDKKKKPAQKVPLPAMATKPKVPVPEFTVKGKQDKLV